MTLYLNFDDIPAVFTGICNGTCHFFYKMKPDSADVVVRAAFCHHCENYIALMEYYAPSEHCMEATTRT